MLRSSCGVLAQTFNSHLGDPAFERFPWVGVWVVSDPHTCSLGGNNQGSSDIPPLRLLGESSQPGTGPSVSVHVHQHEVAVDHTHFVHRCLTLLQTIFNKEIQTSKYQECDVLFPPEGFVAHPELDLTLFSQRDTSRCWSC